MARSKYEQKNRTKSAANVTKNIMFIRVFGILRWKEVILK